jgi:hypothetical protein
MSLRGWVVMLFLAWPSPLAGQTEGEGAEDQTGWEFTGLPALNYDSDEGFGYGAVLSIYNYGDGGFSPYRFTLRPLIYLTTEGRRDLTVFFDAPKLLPEAWRLTAFVGLEKHIATPYYGIGNDTPFYPEHTEGESPYFYRFGREKIVLRGTLQRQVADLPLRILVGAQLAHFDIDPIPKGEGTTLLSEELDLWPGEAMPVEDPGGAQNSVRAGIIWDTRDRESGPQSGAWSSVLVERVAEGLGSADSYMRLTLTDRRYFLFRRGLVFANRLVLQETTGDPPFYALSYIQSSFSAGEGLGGAGSLRGVLKNRYIGQGLFFWNAEVRWRFGEVRIFGKAGHLAAIGFLDSGRVWAEGLELSSLFSDLHRGGGGGLRVGLGPNFVVALDLARGSEAGTQTYIGLGYLF